MNADNKQGLGTVLVLGATGKTGRRVKSRLEARGIPVRAASRIDSESYPSSATVPFDWATPDTWKAALQGVRAVYIAYAPDLATPGAVATITDFTALAVASGVEHLVLLSGRGEKDAQRCEKIVQNAGVDWTILRASWFAQNFSEAFISDMVTAGVVALPAGDIEEPFIDVDDIADVAAEVLSEPGHESQLYELTGPRLMSFANAISEIAAVTGHELNFQRISAADFVSGLRQEGVPEDLQDLLGYLFREVLDGRNAFLADGVQRALGRAPRDFSDYLANPETRQAWAAAAAA